MQERRTNCPSSAVTRHMTLPFSKKQFLWCQPKQFRVKIFIWSWRPRVCLFQVIEFQGILRLYINLPLHGNWIREDEKWIPSHHPNNKNPAKVQGSIYITATHPSLFTSLIILRWRARLTVNYYVFYSNKEAPQANVKILRDVGILHK